jgi:hypothetical protein
MLDLVGQWGKTPLLVLTAAARGHTKHKAGQGCERCDLEENHLDWFDLETAATQKIRGLEVSESLYTFTSSSIEAQLALTARNSQSSDARVYCDRPRSSPSIA